ncbi:uncharacterized protein B0P05DRAFT_471945, partial [Gilbertella persicaria]|uniref:uncharacterized protein n=1 Tax=Gilbertella persicaria TaxID=101096 RepID=UPI002220BB41
TTSSDFLSSCISKQSKLSQEDKEMTKQMFDKLDKSKMWKLSTGTVLEEKMREFALNCLYEQ